MKVLEIEPTVGEETTLKRPDKALSKLTLEDVMGKGKEESNGSHGKAQGLSNTMLAWILGSLTTALITALFGYQAVSFKMVNQSIEMVNQRIDFGYNHLLSLHPGVEKTLPQGSVIEPTPGFQGQLDEIAANLKPSHTDETGLANSNHSDEKVSRAQIMLAIIKNLNPKDSLEVATNNNVSSEEVLRFACNYIKAKVNPSEESATTHMSNGPELKASVSK